MSVKFVIINVERASYKLITSIFSSFSPVFRLSKLRQSADGVHVKNWCFFSENSKFYIVN